MRLTFLTAVAGLTAAPASAQIRVAMGEEVVFTVADATSKLVRREPIKISAYENAIAQEFARGAHDDAIGATAKLMPDRDDRPTAPIPEPGKIRVRFTPVLREAQALLVVENGYDQALVYRATIGKAEKSASTDVCLVMPGKVTSEHWPYKIDWIELRDFRFVPWKPGDPLPCA